MILFSNGAFSLLSVQSGLLNSLCVRLAGTPPLRVPKFVPSTRQTTALLYRMFVPMETAQSPSQPARLASRAGVLERLAPRDDFKL